MVYFFCEREQGVYARGMATPTASPASHSEPSRLRKLDSSTQVSAPPQRDRRVDQAHLVGDKVRLTVELGLALTLTQTNPNPNPNPNPSRRVDQALSRPTSCSEASLASSGLGGKPSMSTYGRAATPAACTRLGLGLGLGLG